MVVRRYLPAFIMLAVLMTGLLSSAYILSIAFPSLIQNYGAWLNGANARIVEAAINKENPFYKPFSSLWSQAEFRLLKQGLAGLVIGKDGQLYTMDEFVYTRQSEINFQRNKAFIQRTVQFFQLHNIKLYVALIPAKAHVNGISPSYRQKMYQDFRLWANRNNILLCDIAPGLLSAHDKVFFDTDTHWTPRGANIAAQELARCIYPRKVKRDATESDVILSHKGDLLSYLPFDKKTEFYPSYRYAKPGTTQDLFGASVPNIVLVGTSYSANPTWQFHAALESVLSTSVLNMAREGLGPFDAMDHYQSYFSAHPNPAPKIIIWEIPERYLSLSSLSVGHK